MSMIHTVRITIWWPDPTSIRRWRCSHMATECDVAAKALAKQ